MRKLFTITLFICCALLVFAPLQAQEASGIIHEGNTTDAGYFELFNPLLCSSRWCMQIGQMLFPMVLAVDPQTSTFVPAIADNGGLVTDWQLSEDGTQWTMTLRDDATWSDGTPITAYDVFFSFAAIQSQSFASGYLSRIAEYVKGIVPLNDTQFVLIANEHTCDALFGAQFPVVPAHVYDSDFATYTADFFAQVEGHVATQWQLWDDESEYSFGYIADHPFDDAPTVNYGNFRFDEWQRTDFIRLRSNSGDLVYEFTETPSSETAIDRFFNGEITLLSDVPRDDWDDLAARADVQTYEYPGMNWDFILFNLADPFEPASYRDDDGVIQEQGVHPIFGDVRVRRAVQMGIDVSAVIETALFGHGTTLYADQVPLSWAYDPTIQPIGYDPEAAADLLDEAGWYLLPGGTRVCIHCTTAEEGTPLAFNLTYGADFYHHYIAAEVIEQQLGRLGMQVEVFEMGYSQDPAQSFDAYLGTWIEDYPATPDRLDLFDPENDVLFTGLNAGSYNNPELVSILQQARTVPNCDMAARRELYSQAANIMQADQPYVWLYAQNELVAVRGSVQNFDPIPGAPFWNIHQWVVWD